MMNTVKGTLEGIDVVLYIVEAGQKYISEDEAKWLSNIKNGSAKSILVVNKTDAHPKDLILGTIALYSERLMPETAIPISALKNEGLDILMSEIIKILPEGPKYYPDDTLTDQMEKVIAAELIREKALLLLEDEVPHGIGVVVEYFRERENSDLLDITADIICDRESHKRIVIGKQGLMLKKIGTLAREDMERIFGNKIFLTLWVKVREGWRNKQGVLRELGYDK
jgi:GTP-binding protein Era